MTAGRRIYIPWSCFYSRPVQNCIKPMITIKANSFWTLRDYLWESRRNFSSAAKFLVFFFFNFGSFPPSEVTEISSSWVLDRSLIWYREFSQVFEWFIFSHTQMIFVLRCVVEKGICPRLFWRGFFAFHFLLHLQIYLFSWDTISFLLSCGPCPSWSLHCHTSQVFEDWKINYN